MTESWGPKRWLKQCTAVDADSGRRCTLLEHAGDHSASGRVFSLVLQPGFAPTRQVDRYATAQGEASLEVGRVGRDARAVAARTRRWREKMKAAELREGPAT